MRPTFCLRRAALLGCLALLAPAVQADEALLAVAANFTEVAQRLAQAFGQQGDTQVTVTSGSTGKLYAQIMHGAPFDLLLAADEKRPRLLEANGRAVPGSFRVYAEGKLALWSADPARIRGDAASALRGASFRRLAIANPELAPYGLAAKQTLTALGLWDEVAARIVMGENIGQTHALVATGNAELGFVALSYVLSPANGERGSYWEVPGTLHAPIRQALVLLRHGEENRAARAFLGFLESDAARSIIESYGYGAG